MKMMFPALLLVLGVAVLSGCATPAPYDPFLGKDFPFTDTSHVVALSPLQVQTNNPNAILAKQTIEAMIEQALRERGFKVIPVTETQPIQTKLLEQVGGLYDPNTGSPDKGKIEAYELHYREQLASQFASEMVVLPVLRTVRVSFTQNIANWHGVGERMVEGRGLSAILVPQMNGTAPALSLLISLEDMTGTPLYAGWGGIQMLNKIAGTQLYSIPETQILADQTLNSNAVVIALTPLLEKIDAAGTGQQSGPGSR